MTKALIEGTLVYGASDDLIELNGECRGEVGCFGTDDDENGVLLMFSDATVLEVRYCKRVPGVWGVDVLRKGSLFKQIDPCDDEDADPYSDVAVFRSGLKWCYAAKNEWELVS